MVVAPLRMWYASIIVRWLAYATVALVVALVRGAEPGRALLETVVVAAAFGALGSLIAVLRRRAPDERPLQPGSTKLGLAQLLRLRWWRHLLPLGVVGVAYLGLGPGILPALAGVALGGVVITAVAAGLDARRVRRGALEQFLDVDDPQAARAVVYVAAAGDAPAEPALR